MIIDPGNFTESIVVRSRTLSVDADTNEQTESWSTYLSSWRAEVSPVRASEKFKSARELVTRQARFVGYFISGLTETMRVQWDGRDWGIVSIAELDRKFYHEILAEVIA